MVTLLMIWYLNKRTILSIPNMKNLHFGDYLRSGNCLPLIYAIISEASMFPSIVLLGFDVFSSTEFKFKAFFP